MVNKTLQNSLIFYNYKEPLKEVKGGYGYYGVVLSTSDGESIQCHICGALMKDLSKHINMTHKMRAMKYREKFGLSRSTVLISEPERQRRKLLFIKYMKSLSPQERKLREFKRMKGVMRFKKRNPGFAHGLKIALETRNKRGTCPDQLLHKINQVAKEIGHSPTKAEFIDYWKSQKYIHIIYKTFGSWDKAKEMAGLEKSKNTSGKGMKRHCYQKEELLEYLKIFFEENGKVPTGTDCRRGLIPDSSIYVRHFGSFPQARVLAGIETEPQGRWGQKT